MKFLKEEIELINNFRSLFNEVKKNLTLKKEEKLKYDIRFYKNRNLLIIHIGFIKLNLTVTKEVFSILLNGKNNYFNYDNLFEEYYRERIKNIILSNIKRLKKKEEIFNYFKVQILKKYFEFYEYNENFLVKKISDSYRLYYYIDSGKFKKISLKEDKIEAKTHSIPFAFGIDDDYLKVLNFKNKKIHTISIFKKNNIFFFKENDIFMKFTKKNQDFLKISEKIKNKHYELVEVKNGEVLRVFFVTSDFFGNNFFYELEVNSKRVFVKKKIKLNCFSVIKKDFNYIFLSENFFYNLKTREIIKTKQNDINFLNSRDKTEEFYYITNNKIRFLKIPKIFQNFVIDYNFSNFEKKFIVLDKGNEELKAIFLHGEFYFLRTNSKLFTDNKKKLYKNLMNNKKELRKENNKILMNFNL